MPNLAAVDWMILLIYFFFVISIGLGLRQYIAGSQDFLLAGRALPAWICGLGFAGASLGALEVLGMGAAGARYGLTSASFFGLGSIIPLLFVGLYMAPIYYRSKARSVPEYLRLRFDEKTRVLNACLMLAISILSAALALYAMARVSAALHLFDAMFHAGTVGSFGVLMLCVAIPAAVVLVYVVLGGLGATIYSQAMQFCVLVAGFLPMVFLGLKQEGGWSGMKAGFSSAVAVHAAVGATPTALALAVGLGIVLTAGLWATDFSLLQTALAAKSAAAARRTPLIAAALKVLLPFVLVVPGIVAIGLPTPRTSETVRNTNGEIYHEIDVVPQAVELGQGVVPAETDSTADPLGGKVLRGPGGRPILDYGMATPNLVPNNLPTGLLGLGLTALLACLVGGVAGRISAVHTVFTCDIYQAHIRKDASEKHLVAVGRWAALGAVVISAGLACVALRLHGVPGILDLLALSLAVFSAPMLMTFVLGMFWKRATGHGAFAGLLAGFAAALAHYGLTLPAGAQRGIAGGWIAVLHHPPSVLNQSGGTALGAIVVNLLVTVVVSLCTRPRAAAELAGLVHSLAAPPPVNRIWWKRPESLAAAVLLAAIAVSAILS